MQNVPEGAGKLGEVMKTERGMSSTPILAWHFVNGALRDGRAIPDDGVELRHDGAVEMCRTGLHASHRLIDAFRYAPGNTLCRVEMRQVVAEDDDKLVARSRTILWRIDAGPVLRQFARDCALEVLHLWEAPDVVVEYLLSGDEALRAAACAAAWDVACAAAWDAMWAAAGDAARDAARDAAWNAAGAAAGDAAWNAACAAAWAAAGAAAGDAAGDAARDAARDAAWDAARAAAGDAACAAAWAAAGAHMERMVLEAAGRSAA